MTAHPGITGKINIPGRPLKDITAPERSIPITQAPAGEMLRRHASYFEFISDLRVFPPIKFDNFIDPACVEERAIAEAGYKAWLMFDAQSCKCLDIQMIVMIMTDEHDVDGR